MKKSEMYRIAQIAVLGTMKVEAEEKLPILRELMRAEDLEKFSEREEEKDA